MSDPLRSDESAAVRAATEPDRNTKIEQLLLDGLDEYFAGRYDQAVNVWTRALFFDRHHARARAYIERARAALAERQRESEELLESGVAAFNRGDVAVARRLLEDAIERGAPSDEARSILARLSRIEPRDAPTPPPGPSLLADAGNSMATALARPRVSRAPLWFAVGALAAAVALTLVTLIEPAWSPSALSSDAPAAGLPPARLEPGRLPVPRRGEETLARARRFASTGRLYDALAALESIAPTDVHRPDADRLRAEIQQQLLSLVSDAVPATAP